MKSDKRHILWIGELLIWGLLIFGAIFFSLYLYNKDTRENHTYYVFFKDIDGLIKGSPVKVQGYQVGYVSNISIVNEDIFVTFIITDKDLTMPKTLDATVAFTGMGGSKSLELFVPPLGQKTKNIVTTIEPRRLQDFYVYQNQIAQNIETMTTGFMKIFNDENSSLLKSFIKNPKAINDTDKVLNNIQSNENKIMKQLEKK